jgi:hypothetical protein
VRSEILERTLEWRPAGSNEALAIELVPFFEELSAAEL